MKDLKTQYTSKQDLELLYSEQGDPLCSADKQQEITKIIKKTELPTGKEEKWRKTNLKSLLKHKFKYGKKYNITNNIIKDFNIAGTKTNVIVFINGHYISELSEIIEEPDVLILDSMSNTKSEQTDFFNKHFDSTGLSTNNIFAALNTRYATDGAFVLVKKNKKAENPIHIHNFTAGDSTKTASLIRNLIFIEESAKANVIISFHPLSNNYTYTNIATEIFLSKNSHLDINYFQGEGNDSFQTNQTFVKQAKDSNFHANTFSLCGQFIKNDINISIESSNCYTELNGLYLLDREQHINTSINIDHKVGHSVSNQFYRGILDNKASAVFYGLSKIFAKAIKTDIKQVNNNILLTDQAKIHSKPQLIIDNDDVTAAHGSTVGQLDKDAMFYMQTRGIGKDKAKMLLLYAFAEEVVDKIQLDKLKLFYKTLIKKRLSGTKIEMQCARLGECRIC